MSESADFYLSWLGCGAFGANGVRLRDSEPIVFRPTDISGCVLWMDANNNDAVQYNDLLQVSSWSNSGTLGGQFDLSGGVVTYGQATQNGLNTVSFNSNAFMSGTFQFNFQARTLFIVTRETGVPAGVPSPWITCDTNGGMESFSQHDGTTIYYIGKHNNVFPELAAESSVDYTNYAAIFSFTNATDLSDNSVVLNTTPATITYNNVATGYNTGSITYFLGDYVNGTSVGNSQDMCEIILYNTALSEPERINVIEYLRRKWAISDPPPPPFAPTDISGLQLWLDANNSSSLTLSGSDVVSWSNLGAVGTLYNAECNVATSVSGPGATTLIAFPEATTLSNYSSLPYVSRTAFAVFQSVADYPSLTYPYLNIMATSATDGRQLGFSYDSNTTAYGMAMCQSGTNCPIVGTIPAIDTNMALAIWVSDSNTTANTLAYYNGGSNVNTSTDLGNLFSTLPIPYQIGSPNTGSPGFRVGEILEYDSVLSASNISNVANYLVTKWAISSFQTIV